MNTQIHQLPNKLTGDKKDVIIERFFNKKTLDEIAGYKGLSKERIRQIQNEAIQELRECLRDNPLAKELKGYL
ncbi:hypothetical protein KY366_05290 [Candidatus Woesearchaeota archaeon]|nr:hypothetical protein [Candidatus Woesearchaeota archaeon]